MFYQCVLAFDNKKLYLAMQEKKKEHPKVKSKLHPRSKHRERYDFKELVACTPALADFIYVNKYGDKSVDFFNPLVVRTLNKALLKHHYGIDHWNIPENYLCPPIPGRADYIHHIADLLATYNNGEIPKGENLTCLDIGVGASCVYPIIGNREYGWSFIGSDIDSVALESAQKIIDANPVLEGKIELRLQNHKQDLFHGILEDDERVDLVVCNPPFHASEAEAKSATLRKLSNLKQQKVRKATLNFGGKNTELWCKGGEKRFVKNMIYESRQFANSCFLFSTLVSKEANLESIYKVLKEVKPVDVKTIPMGQGNKISRIVAWTFIDKN